MPYPIQAAGAQSHWSVELLLGEAYNARSDTRIEQGTLGRLSTSGDYETRGLEAPFHYAWRIARWQENGAWELQLLHHKLYLTNPPDGIDSLSVSHGFNIVSINRAIQSGGWRFRAGVGPVITHAEANIAGTVYDGPYELAGAAVLVGAGHTLNFGCTFFWWAKSPLPSAGSTRIHEGTPICRSAFVTRLCTRSSVWAIGSDRLTTRRR